MSEVASLARHVASLTDRTPHMRKILAMQAWVDAGGWQPMSDDTSFRFHVVIETSAGPHDSPKLRAPQHFTKDTDFSSLYWRSHQSFVMPAAGDIL